MAAVGCVASVAVTVYALAVPAAGARLGLALPSAEGYAVGTRIDVPASVYGGTPYTAILFADRNCGACQRLKPWLAGLATALQRQPQVRVVMVTTATRSADEVAYAAELGLARDAVVPLSLGTLRVRTWPTLVVTDRRGIVQYAHDGVPTEEAGRTEMLEAIRSAAHER